LKAFAQAPAEPQAAPSEAVSNLIEAAMDLEKDQGANAGMDESCSTWQRLKSAERVVLAALSAQAAVRPDILEKLTYHAHERDDMTIDDLLEVLASGYRKVHGRTERQMQLQLLSLLAAAPIVAVEPQPNAQGASGALNASDDQAWLPFGIIDPDYARVFTMARVLAWQEGYALAMHGSFTRDLDLIAFPWTDKACEPDHLVRRVADATGLGLQSDQGSEHPHGRMVWTLLFPGFADPRFVDFGVMPRLFV
jgi:hypothetical protein